MAEDLVRRYSVPAKKRLGTIPALAASIRLVAWVVETWWYVTRR
jgi:hypothetical protein